MKKNTKSGYAILFTLVIITIMMTFAMGMSNSMLKEMLLSSTASNSQTAFYQADTAGECAIYLATHNADLSLGLPINCGINTNGSPVLMNVTTTALNKYSLAPAQPSSPDPCFNIEIDKSAAPLTTVRARGYNICDQNSGGRIERGIEITF